MIPARFAIDVHAQDIVVNEQRNYLSREYSHSELAHWKLLEVLDVVSLYVVVE